MVLALFWRNVIVNVFCFCFIEAEGPKILQKEYVFFLSSFFSIENSSESYIA